MNSHRRLSAIILLVACVSCAAFIRLHADEPKQKKPSAEEVSKQWSYPYTGGSTASVPNGNIQYNQLVFKIKGSYNDTFDKVAKFYGDKCGSRTDYSKLVSMDKGESQDGGKFIATDLRLEAPREMDFFYDRPEYTVSVFIHAQGKEEMEVRVTVAVR